MSAYIRAVIDMCFREQVQAKTGRDPVTLPDAMASGLDLDVQTGGKR